ncbi:flagellar basal body P-ring formation chaperone FlgA [Ketogulonicigenium vulgare]|uniref:Flagella basal body P-ring formation protein FlgA n=1 Tax=Ketogulonicigenium vulgare (strain WSH-001) TaxID=759362 RepID=F9Y4G2_KETVW|nr:flagellar basal body P-ring formation chaperone FlgA [Ketogulonicigenium vulgare]ADO43496.1 flagella basal body P-ring formation protein FlgA [Ketogulonicigenium vulgare Y25]AEM41775.1 Flagella basal body P-ring formation protein FlgA [Ketogulonicigenium vulgare WSH-001]ALJ81881.1 flagellar biosynthesis protein FlgA [Ketogulonicigenium vulgare]ANW34530.1 flagella basal body P-ring formation protein FlgA [Ketogulonicigenium vulgare]AOZ55531.1 flagella basal body P-ring formation protein FlgA
MRALALALSLIAGTAQADYVVAQRNLPANGIITADLLGLRPGEVPGAITDPSEIIGLEARTPIYAGRPLQASQFGQPAIVQRNQVIAMQFTRGALTIMAEGRALERAGPGDLIRVMNLQSRTTIMARIGVEGTAYVTP